MYKVWYALHPDPHPTINKCNKDINKYLPIYLLYICFYLKYFITYFSEESALLLNTFRNYFKHLTQLIRGGEKIVTFKIYDANHDPPPQTLTEIDEKLGIFPRSRGFKDLLKVTFSATFAERNRPPSL